MLTYNTQLKTLVLPEYGRNIQQMVDYCVSIPDREERTVCAHSIIASMGNLFPELRDVDDFRHKLWDHLAIMADFKLDIDFPYEVVKPESLATRPEPIHYKQGQIALRHYGRYIEDMIEKAVGMEPGEERDALAYLIADHMKKVLTQLNTDGVDDAKVFKDLAHYSHGVLRLDPREVHLHQYKAAPAPQQQGKKKKKK